MKQVQIAKERKSKHIRTLLSDEIAALLTDSGKGAWLNKTRLDIAVQLSTVQQEVRNASVSTLHSLNKLIMAAVRLFL